MLTWLKQLLSRDKPVSAALYLYNTLGKSKQVFTLPDKVEGALGPKTVRMYNCGPTVYDVQHIGNLSMFVFADVLRKVLEYNGFAVKQVINITDVGHLTSDADFGDDKMAKGLKREGKELTLENMRELGERYTQIFLNDISLLNIDAEQITFPRASAYIPAQIAMVATLEEKGYAYRAKDGVYYDTSRFPSYGALGEINLENQKEGARITAVSDKRNPADFILWKLDPNLGWESPWGKGFPGWHIECSAMIRATLGKQIDIHTGGIEHIAVHHNNEIAQSEVVTGKHPLSRFWIHRAHIQLEHAKIAKSEGNIVYLSEVVARGIHPLALRYLFLGAHYRTPSNFSWEALLASETAFLRLRLLADSLPKGGKVPANYRVRMQERFNDDVDTAGALGVMWEMINDKKLPPADVRAGLIDADRVLGLGLDREDAKAKEACLKRFGKRMEMDELPEDIRAKIQERAIARENKDWQKADLVRNNLAKNGYVLEDAETGTIVFKK
ncbi:MAG: cysteine--tRNA ligase [Candidatus Kaiserbacteria bacterium]|nr:cysteine--tRNA ligase [Candidatus Kaiserbacteria bacterium]